MCDVVVPEHEFIHINEPSSIRRKLVVCVPWTVAQKVRIRLSNNAKHSIKCFANPIGSAVHPAVLPRQAYLKDGHFGPLSNTAK
jgi:hypothetical protein